MASHHRWMSDWSWESTVCVPVFACLRASVRVASHILHACNVCWSQVNAFPLSSPWCLPACLPAGPGDRWMNGFPSTSVHSHTHAGVIESQAGVSKRWPRVSILLITILFKFYDALARSFSLSLRPWQGEKENEGRMWGMEGGERFNGCGSGCRVITCLNDQPYLALLLTLAPSA